MTDHKIADRFDLQGHAIVSADGMIAAADGSRPPQLQNDADWQLFQAALDRAALVVIGRISHQLHPNPGRRRLVLTRQIVTMEPDPNDRNATLWNPAGMGLPEVLAALNIGGGIVAITGVFDVFAARFDHFDLVEVSGFALPDGVPCFTTGSPRSVLARHGLRPRPGLEIDPGVTLTRWAR